MTGTMTNVLVSWACSLIFFNGPEKNASEQAHGERGSEEVYIDIFASAFPLLNIFNICVAHGSVNGTNRDISQSPASCRVIAQNHIKALNRQRRVHTNRHPCSDQTTDQIHSVPLRHKRCLRSPFYASTMKSGRTESKRKQSFAPVSLELLTATFLSSQGNITRWNKRWIVISTRLTRDRMRAFGVSFTLEGSLGWNYNRGSHSSGVSLCATWKLSFSFQTGTPILPVPLSGSNENDKHRWNPHSWTGRLIRNKKVYRYNFCRWAHLFNNSHFSKKKK